MPAPTSDDAAGRQPLALAAAGRGLVDLVPQQHLPWLRLHLQRRCWAGGRDILESS